MIFSRGKSIGGLTAIVFASVVASAPAGAATKNLDPVKLTALSKIMACKSIADPMQRLACMDASVADLDAAEKAGDIVVVDRAQLHTLRRQAFGFPNLTFGFFEKGTRPERVTVVTVTLAGARRTRDGNWLLTTSEGQTWRQTDDTEIFPEPTKGDQATIRAGLLGSYSMKVANGAAMQVHREQ